MEHFNIKGGVAPVYQAFRVGCGLDCGYREIILYDTKFWREKILAK